MSFGKGLFGGLLAARRNRRATPLLSTLVGEDGLTPLERLLGRKRAVRNNTMVTAPPEQSDLTTPPIV